MPATSKQRTARTKAPDAKGSTDGGNRRKTRSDSKEQTRSKSRRATKAPGH